MSEESEKTEQVVSEATIREIAKRRTDVSVLKYFLEVDELAYAQEIADILLMDPSGVSFSLKKLVSCDLVQEEKQKADSRVKYYRLLDEMAAKRVLAYFEKLRARQESRTKVSGEPEEI